MYSQLRWPQSLLKNSKSDTQSRNYPSSVVHSFFSASMRFIQALLAWIVPIASAHILEPGETNNKEVLPDKEFLIETAPGETQWVTLDDKWKLRRNGQRFMDITATRDLGTVNTAAKEPVIFPYKCRHSFGVKPLIKYMSERRMRRNLKWLTSFHTRYYNSEYGRQSSDWILETVKYLTKRSVIKNRELSHFVTFKRFDHPWKQSSVIARIAGESETTIVIGAHLDSINLWLPTLSAPGADSGGSGAVTILEVFSALLESPHLRKQKAANTIEFHWYSGGEGGLLGSQAIFRDYEKYEHDVKAMLQQDMTGYIKGTLDAGLPERFGVVVDHVDAGLTRFIKTVIEQYCSIPWVETECGYACSDHASASKAGYPSAFVMESSFGNLNQHIHNSSDLIDNVSFYHMLEHAKMTLGFAYELAFHKFETTKMIMDG
ncbi:Leucine aminopeptidase 1 [Epichloe festucae Fl1]|uniref:Peptide hydrolase n=1 Tax=Epichloe festucae (strain Fl1) TaxID=877507 RepID=A0A7S9PT41_EPIFF|nr:Leucine aminopeptidase 1 [Epichloe festucae Fl1]